MRSKPLLAVAIVAAAGIWVAAQQEVLPRPGPGSGTMNVRGTVDIGNSPEVRVANTPDVRVSNAPDVRVVHMPPDAMPGPAFLRKGNRYAVTWPDGKTETVTIVSTAAGAGWAQVSSNKGERWINVNAALAVERLP